MTEYVNESITRRFRKSALFGLVVVSSLSSFDAIGREGRDPAAAFSDIEGPGCAAGVFRKGKAEALVLTGWRDVELRRPITADTRFYAASVSKQFTALAVMQLVSQDRLDLSESVRRYIPELPPYAEDITLAMLVEHRSGIKDDIPLLFMEGHDDLSAVSREAALHALYRQGSPQFTPGTSYAYSNGNYLLMSEIVERASGQSFASYMRDHILQPLGMTRSYFVEGSTRPDDNLATGYAIAKNDSLMIANRFPLYAGSGGLVTTLNDMGAWDRDIDGGGKVWTPRIATLMTNPHALLSDDGNISAYVGGLQRQGDWLHHSGTAAGFKAGYARNRAARLGIVMLCNRGDVAFGERLGALIAAVAPGLANPADSAAPTAGALEGSFTSPDVGATYHIVPQEEGLVLAVRRTDDATVQWRMTKEKDGSFTLPNAAGYVGVAMKLVPDTDGKGFSLHLLNETVRFQKYPN